MTESTPTTTPVYGPAETTLHALRGIRFIDGEGGGAPAAAASATESAVTPPAGTESQPNPSDAASGAQNSATETVESLPAWAQAEIRKARKEAGDYRTAKNTTQAEFEAFKDEVAVRLGLKQPATPADPALAAAQTAAKNAATDLAVLRAAGNTVNVDRLLDSASFQANVRALDHTAADFTSQVAALITSATTADPTLKTVRATGSSAPDLGATTGEQGRISEADLQKATPDQIVEWADKGLLDHLL